MPSHFPYCQCVRPSSRHSPVRIPLHPWSRPSFLHAVAEAAAEARAMTRKAANGDGSAQCRSKSRPPTRNGAYAALEISAAPGPAAT